MNISRILYFIAAFSLASPVLAAPALETLNYARFYGAADPRVVYACENTNGVACNGSARVPGTNWTANYYSQGSGMFGVLKNQASVVVTGNASGGTFPSFMSVGSRSGFRDSYTIGGGSGAGTLSFSFGVTGDTAAGPGAFAGSTFQWVPASNGESDWNNVIGFGVVDGRATVNIPFVFNQAMEGTLYFYALAQVFQFQQTAAMADFSHTAILDAIYIENAEGLRLTDFQITSASGTAYTANGVVPEPATLALFGAAFFALLWFRRKQQNNHGLTPC